jgi:iron complex transport system ATP-binding protein
MKSSLFGASPKKADRRAVEEWLEKTGLSTLRNKQLNELSGGQLQRVFLAQAMVQEPEIILLDEPTNHLDVKYQLELIEYLKAWSKGKNRTVIGVFHDINLALQLSEHLVFMKDGKIQGHGQAEEVLSASFLKNLYDVDIAGYMRRSLEKWKKIK